MAESLPQYEIDDPRQAEDGAGRHAGPRDAGRGGPHDEPPRRGGRRRRRRRARATLEGAPLTASGAVPVEVRPRTQTPVEVISHLFSSIWGPLGRASIVLIVMVFVLLEHESLRDRFIRLLGGSDLRRTTQAFNDAGERLSRFFVSQLAVNVGVGVAIWLGLMLIGLPHGAAVGGAHGAAALRALRGRVHRRGQRRADGRGGRSGLDADVRGAGPVRGGRAARVAGRRAAAVRPQHGAVAAVGGGGGHLLELDLGPDRPARVDAADAVPGGRRAATSRALQPSSTCCWATRRRCRCRSASTSARCRATTRRSSRRRTPTSSASRSRATATRS